MNIMIHTHIYENLCELRIFLGSSHRNSTQISLSKMGSYLVDKEYLRAPPEEPQGKLETRTELL